VLIEEEEEEEDEGGEEEEEEEEEVSRPDHREPLVLYGIVGQGVTRGVF
jgi:hypothetical protein